MSGSPALVWATTCNLPAVFRWAPGRGPRRRASGGGSVDFIDRRDRVLQQRRLQTIFPRTPR